MSDHVMTDMDCRTETVKFRARSGPHRGEIVQFKRRVGRDCPKRRPPSARHLRPYQYESKAKRAARADDPRLNGAACSNSPRWVRGGVGFLLGGMLGGMIAGGVVFATTMSSDVLEPISSFNRVRTMMLVGTGITVLGAAAGLTIGAAKPEC